MKLFCTVVRLKVLFMNVFDAETKIIDIEVFLQHTIADLNSIITLYFFVHSREDFKMKGNKHTHTHTHTQTHTHTHTHRQQLISVLSEELLETEQDLTEQLKIKFNTRSNLRQKVSHPSINTKKDEGAPA